jgi:hypothetical protein
MSNILIQRQPPDATTIQGRINVDGTPVFFSLENAAKAIPAGTYNAKFYDSPRMQRVFNVPHFWVILLTDVPGRDMCEMHPGNRYVNFEGCIGVGETEGKDWIGESDIALKALLLMVQEPMTVEVRDPDPTGSFGSGAMIATG